MTKLPPKRIVCIVICTLVWVTTLVALCFTRHWLVLLGAALHSLALLYLLLVASAYIRIPPPKAPPAKKEKPSMDYLDELIRIDMLDDDDD